MLITVERRKDGCGFYKKAGGFFSLYAAPGDLLGAFYRSGQRAAFPRFSATPWEKNQIMCKYKELSLEVIWEIHKVFQLKLFISRVDTTSFP